VQPNRTLPALALLFTLIAACSNHDQITAAVCSADETASKPCSSVGATCVNPGFDPPSCTCTHSGWSCPMHRDAQLADAEADGEPDADDASDDYQDDFPQLILNLGDASMPDDAKGDATSDIAQTDAPASDGNGE
jgi:hypothetical protein